MSTNRVCVVQPSSVGRMERRLFSFYLINSKTAGPQITILCSSKLPKRSDACHGTNFMLTETAKCLITLKSFGQFWTRMYINRKNGPLVAKANYRNVCVPEIELNNNATFILLHCLLVEQFIHLTRYDAVQKRHNKQFHRMLNPKMLKIRGCSSRAEQLQP